MCKAKKSVLIFFQLGIQNGSQTELQLIHGLSVSPILGSGDANICPRQSLFTRNIFMSR